MAAGVGHARVWAFGGVFVLTGLAGADASAQQVLRVYGSEGPAPAIQEAAAVFGEEHQARVEVVTGPPDTWVVQAAAQADVIFASADFMMADFVRRSELKIAESSVTPLYLRPSAVLVRPGNPKQIGDFPDLLKPGVRVMVVSGSGQTGLWEDMAGKQGDVRTIRAFRENIAVFAPSSTEALKLWDERPDIDAYVTWNIWHVPLRDRATLVEVSRDYTIYRQCSIALTERGKEHPLGGRFIAFLASPAGARIFQSWQWLTAPGEPEPRPARKDVAVVCRIDKDEWKANLGAGLSMVRELAQVYRSPAGAPERVRLSAVVHGEAAYWLLKDESYPRVVAGATGNPNRELVEELQSLGVSVELCGATMTERGWTDADILAGVKIVPNAYARMVELELEGYAYVRF